MNRHLFQFLFYLFVVGLLFIVWPQFSFIAFTIGYWGTYAVIEMIRANY